MASEKLLSNQVVVFRMTVKSRFNNVNSIIAPTLLVIFLTAMACLIMFLSFKDVENGKVDSILKTPIYGSIILFGAVILTTIHYIKICKSICIDNKGIKLSNLFKSEFIPWNDIRKIELIAKSQDGAMMPMDAANLILKSGRQLDILAPYYENMATIRQTLKQVVECQEANKPIELMPLQTTSKVEPIIFIDLNEMTKYSDNHILSFNGLLIYGLNALTIYMTLNSSNYFGALFITSILIFAFTYSVFGRQLHYYYLDKNYLVIKNHVWPWVNFTYRIDNIKQVSVEVPYRRSTALRVITKDYQSKVFSGGSLKSSTWKELLNGIQKLNVKTENEIF